MRFVLLDSKKLNDTEKRNTLNSKKICRLNLSTLYGSIVVKLFSRMTRNKQFYCNSLVFLGL